MGIHKTSKTQQGCTEIQLLNTSEIILVIVEELIFIYYLTLLADMIIGTPWKHCNATEQEKETNKQSEKANNKPHQKSEKKGVLSEYYKIHNRNTKYCFIIGF